MLREEYNKIVNEMTLTSLQAEGAHISEYHFELTDEQLKRRCKSLRGEDSVRGATVFDISQQEAIEHIKEVFLDEDFDNPGCVLEWLDDASDGGDFILFKTFNTPVGHGYYRASWHEWKDGPKQCYEIIIVLKKVERRYDTIFQVVTAYPSR